MKGIIALDIDGTITTEMHSMPREVVEFLNSLAQEGWRIIFITGRTFTWGYEVLNCLPFAYDVAVQNGAILLQMPSRKILSKKYLNTTIFPAMNTICCDEPSDFVLYGGFETNDQCFYRPDYFSSDLLTYVQTRTMTLKENWYPVDSYDEVSLEEFPSIKCFGRYDSALRISQKIEGSLGLHAPIIRDPFDETYYVIQATHPDINKGQALQDFIRLTGHKGIIIAAGDDNNDLSMLAVADVKIIMATASEEVRKYGDIIAPPASEYGIIAGLKEAIQTSVKKI
jgi:hydroxymethylpyrimidine pyrophosphatase-like HAD family hydrolase